MTNSNSPINSNSTNSKLSFWAFVGIFSLLYILLTDATEYCHQPMGGFSDVLFTTGMFAAMALIQAMFIVLVTINRYVFAVMAPLLLIIGTSLTYFFVTLRVTLSATIVGLALTNDFATSSDLITWPLVLCVLLSIAASVIVVYVRFRYVSKLSRKKGFIVAGVIIVLLFGVFSVPRVKRIVNYRQPFIVLYSVNGYFSLRQDVLQQRHNFDNEICSSTNDTITVVLVIGESLRPDHLGINGYERNTTPNLAKIQNLVSYPNLNVTTFHTAISVPRLMTRADEQNDEVAYTEQSFITLFKNAGFSSYWIANQEPLNYFVYFVEESDVFIPTYVGHSFYNYDKWLDGEMLDDYQKILNEGSLKKLIVMHSIGNHWWYKSHYDEAHAQYKPDLTSRNMNGNTAEQMINSYDNCVLYTDWFLNEVIAPLRDKNAIVIYVSDHGESLGENGMFLHGELTKETGMAALMFWMSDIYKENNPEITHNIVQNKDLQLDNDFLFHTILDCGGVVTSVCDTLKSVARVNVPSDNVSPEPSVKP